MTESKEKFNLEQLVYGLIAELDKANQRITSLEKLASDYVTEMNQTEKECIELLNKFKATDESIFKDVVNALYTVM